MKRNHMSNERKERLIKKLGGKCHACGATDVHLDIHHIVPMSFGGIDDDSNLTLLCQSCNLSISNRRFTEIEFNNYLSRILDLSNEFHDVRMEERLSREKPFRADITAKSQDGKGWLIECKNVSSFTPARLHQAIHQIKAYMDATSFDRYVLAFPGLLSEEQKLSLRSHGIDPWDAHELATRFQTEIRNTKHPIFQMLLSFLGPTPRKSPEEVFIEQLKSCKPGKEYWSDYQKLVGRILEHLYCPPLEAPISESADQDKINRRDWILPNYSDEGFWNFLRTKYLADYIIVDAKNYKGAIYKNQVLQIANYLKSHGAGMFAIIVTRVGANKSAHLTIREQWMANKKMILVLNDDDLEAMLLAKSAGGDPEKVIGQSIERFRLSM